MVTAATQNFDINTLLLPLGPAPVPLFGDLSVTDSPNYDPAESLRAAYDDDDDEVDEDEDDEDDEDDLDEDDDYEDDDEEDDDDEDEDDDEEPTYQVYDDDDDDEDEDE